MTELALDEVARLVESAEAAAWWEYFAAAPGEFCAQYGLLARVFGTARLLALPALDAPFYNRVVGLGVGEAAGEAQIDEIIVCARAAGCRQLLFNVSPKARPAAVHGWLLERGAWPVAAWTKLFRGADMPPFVPTDLRIERVGAEFADAFGWLASAVFAVPDDLQPLSAAAVGRPGWHHYLAFDGDFPVAAGAMFIQGEVGWLGFGGTLESHRRRGAQGAILTARVYDGLQMGCRWFVSETEDIVQNGPNPSYKNLLRSGFRLAYLRPNYLIQF